MTVTKAEYKRACKNGTLTVVGTNLTRNGWTEFRVLIPSKDKHTKRFWYKPVIVEGAGYWNPRLGAYKCTAWGTDRRLEVVLAIGYALGLDFHEIKQDYQWIQG